MAPCFALILILSILLLVLVIACTRSSISNYNAFPNYNSEVRGEEELKHYCRPSSCGNVPNISYPFRLKGDPRNCGDSSYELACENNRPILHLFSGKYYVNNIWYHNHTIQIVDTALQEGNCSSLPRHSLTNYNFSNGTNPLERWSLHNPHRIFKDDGYIYRLSRRYISNVLIFATNCGTSTPLLVNSSLYLYTNTTPCLNGNASSQTVPYYVVLGEDIGQLEGCSVGLTISTKLQSQVMRNLSFSDIHHELLKGVELTLPHMLCGSCFAQGVNCFYVGDDNKLVDDAKVFCFSINSLRARLYIFRRLFTSIITLSIFAVSGTSLFVLLMAARTTCGFMCLLAFLIYKFRRRHLFLNDTIEEFLQRHNNLVPIRYSYSEIKKITQGFKNKLGQGGYGSVFKGKLRSGRIVAVKILSKPKANGQEFINEVATIGRIHHVNVVRLMGFCAEGSKRALMYDFMPNGSLEKYIFSGGNESISLSWEKMYEIALGVAHGIEYLHRGCDMQILHFDIKPHNILLDKNFIPKVSDFGLAKLYPVDDSIVSLTAVRGTPGYIAPELFYKNVGGVSYKADVYSFGMLLMEMVGRRKNVNPFAENSSQIYFPAWIYERFNQGEGIDIGDAEEDEKKIVRKLVLVALWCIQMKPADRPSMGKVIEMLEGPVELLQVPPKPFLFSQEYMEIEDNIANANPSESSFISQSAESLPSEALEITSINVLVN